ILGELARLEPLQPLEPIHREHRLAQDEIAVFSIPFYLRLGQGMPHTRRSSSRCQVPGARCQVRWSAKRPTVGPSFQPGTWHLALPLRWLLDELRDTLKEAGRVAAVYQAVVEGETQPQLLPDRHPPVHDRRLRPDASHSEHGALRQVENGSEGVD